MIRPEFFSDEQPSERVLAGTALRTMEGANWVVSNVNLESLYLYKYRQIIAAAATLGGCPNPLSNEWDISFDRFDHGEYITEYFEVGTTAWRIRQVATLTGWAICELFPVAEAGNLFTAARSVQTVSEASQLRKTWKCLNGALRALEENRMDEALDDTSRVLFEISTIRYKEMETI